MTLIANEYAARITIPIEIDIIAPKLLFLALESLLHVSKNPKLVSDLKHVQKYGFECLHTRTISDVEDNEGRTIDWSN